MAKINKVKRRGRPPVGDEVITFRLDKELYARIDDYAAKEVRPISDAIRLLIEAGLASKGKR